MNALVGCAILLVALTGLVVVTMAIENWSRLVQPLVAAEPEPEGETQPERTDTADPTASATAGGASAASHGDAPPTTPAVVRPVTRPARRPVPLAGRPEGAIATGSGTVQLRDPETADVLAGLLFAAYATSKRAGADRAAAWVTAIATPPSADPDRFPAGVALRGRTGRIRELLAHRDGGAVWVTLGSVDISRGVARTPVRQPTLSALVTWWSRTRDLPTAVPPADADAVARSIGALRPILDETPWSEPIGRLHEALAAAAADMEPLLVELAGAPTGHDDPVAATAGAVSAAPRPAAPRRPARSRRADGRRPAPADPS